MTETEIWTKWESQVVNGIFPLRRFLGRSNHSVVFLTECRAQNLAHAAIKIIPADPARAESQLARWQLAASLSHPHLIRLFEAGRCKLGGHAFLFVVSEYAEQNLAQILPHRALTVDEVREMLTPTLDALSFLHRQNLVQGQLKPPNFLVVNDQLKLASDTIRAGGEAGGFDLPGDMRALGATIVEALTQTRPGLQGPVEAPAFPATLPLRLADALWRCLSLQPADRPTISELRYQIDAAPEAAAPEAAAPPVAAQAAGITSQAPAPQALTPALDGPAIEGPALERSAPTHAPVPPAAPAAPRGRASPRDPLPRWLIPAAAVGLVLLALWAGGRLLRSPDSPRPTSPPMASQQPSAPAALQSSVAAASASSPVVHQEIPAVSRAARDSIHGQIKVAVRVTVDRAGNVSAENLEVRGSSKYFARVAADAARKWKFAAADNPAPREWLVQFEFSRSGVSGRAVPPVK
jgi:Protein kinase domain